MTKIAILILIAFALSVVLGLPQSLNEVQKNKDPEYLVQEYYNQKDVTEYLTKTMNNFQSRNTNNKSSESGDSSDSNSSETNSNRNKKTT